MADTDLVEQLFDDVTESEQQEGTGPSDLTDDQAKPTKPDDSAPSKKPAKTKYKQPQDFTDHPWSNGINAFVDAFDPREREMAGKALLGESYVATLVQLMGDEIHPGAIAAVNTVIVGGAIAWAIYTDGARPRKTEKTEGLGIAARLR